MKVKSLIKNESDLVNYGIDKTNGWYIISDRILIVQGIHYEDNKTFILINEDNNTKSFPKWYSMKYFEIIDNVFSQFWISKSYKKGFKYYDSVYGEQILNEDENIIIFPEWANNPNFYWWLSELREYEREIYAKYSTMMYLEFPDENISEKGIFLSEPNWIQCPKCDYPWQEEGDLAMLKCSECGNIMHNPLYFKK